ncbi:MAG TPA: BON domain-containing protein [Casimicrobiaceae bacterium]|nr:BON domain-containing protein [Casimicrobiaceae bacterium]
MARLSLAVPVLVALACAAASARAAPADTGERVQLDPFARATAGDAHCPEQQPPLLSAADARNEAHVRVERGLRCAMDGTCEAGGAYRRDPEVNERTRALIAADLRFADTSVWVTTTRKWVTLQGCVRTQAQHRLLVQVVRRQPGVERVFDELHVGPSRAAHRATP